MQNALNTFNVVLINKSSQGEDISDPYGKLLACKLRKLFSDIEQEEVIRNIFCWSIMVILS